MKRFSSLEEINADLLAGKITMRGLVSYYLENIEKNKSLNAFLEVWPEEALHAADLIEQKIKNGIAGKLAGMVIGLKDNICYKGHKVSASSKILEGFESVYSATVVERLLAEDAIIIGRLNCDEFAMGASNENSAFGRVLNAASHEHVSGGSSGGAAVAVQADLCLATLGSDTGGSVRQPAAFCGVYGLKPTYGRVSRYGLIAYASSFDQIGPLTSSISDMQNIMEVIAGIDPHDATTSAKTVPHFKQTTTKAVAKIAVMKEGLYLEGIDPEVKKAVEATIEKLKLQGHHIEEISFPLLDVLVPIYYVLTTAEASSNLSRFSGLMYGYRSPKAKDLEETFKKSRSEGFGPEVKRRIMLGTFVLSAGFFDAYYSKAQQVRKLVQQKTNELFETFDFILLPTTPTPAFKAGEKSADPIAMYLADIFTVHANISGHPAISVPCGTHSNGLPIGVQLMGNNFCEDELLALAQTL